MWFLWILVIGGIAAEGRNERWWFVNEIGVICAQLDIANVGELKECVKNIVWIEGLLGDGLVVLWEELRTVRALEGF